MQHVTIDSVCQEFVGKRPLPLGEGWGEGLAMTPKYFFLLSYRSGHEKDGVEFSFLVTQLRPHPSPLPMGEGVTYKGLSREEPRNCSLPVFRIR